MITSRGALSFRESVWTGLGFNNDRTWWCTSSKRFHVLVIFIVLALDSLVAIVRAGPSIISFFSNATLTFIFLRDLDWFQRSSKCYVRKQLCELINNSYPKVLSHVISLYPFWILQVNLKNILAIWFKLITCIHLIMKTYVLQYLLISEPCICFT